MNFTTFLKKSWHFIWHEDSLASWIVNVILAFLIVKFILYPVLGFALGTSYPIVAVVSGSMEHDQPFEEWWNSNKDIYEQYTINKEAFTTFPLKNGFNKGDLIILTKAEGIEKGDVIVFQGTLKDPIIHRVVAFNMDGSYQTKGDHNPSSRNDELAIIKKNIHGKALFKVPYLGWFKLLFVEGVNLFTTKQQNIHYQEPQRPTGPPVFNIQL